MISKRFFSVSVRHNLRVAIIGAGPAGFYTAHQVLKKSSHLDVKIDIFERLPAPYGLSRYGVAPDHPEVKNCEEYLDNVMTHDQVRFFGNTTIGKDITLENLKQSYHSVILSYGCTNSDNTLDIPGSNLPGVVLAREFVSWYNGHPDFYEGNHVERFKLDLVENITIIGNGNVAIDVARVLLINPKYWHKTDMSEEAVAILSLAKIKKVNIVARRGLLQSAFTNKEIRELLDLCPPNINFIPIDQALVDEVSSLKLGRVDKRKLAVLTKSRPESGTELKTLSIQYLKSPVEFIGNSTVTHTKFQKNLIIEERVVPQDEFETIPNELVILSIGYHGTPLNGLKELGVSFKDGRVSSFNGRVSSENDTILPGWYTSGWIKTGPKGVIATTMMDSFETADNVVDDLTNGIHLDPIKDSLEITNQVVSWEDWNVLNKYELSEGHELGKTRLKVCYKEKMIEIAINK